MSTVDEIIRELENRRQVLLSRIEEEKRRLLEKNQEYERLRSQLADLDNKVIQARNAGNYILAGNLVQQRNQILYRMMFLRWEINRELSEVDRMTREIRRIENRILGLRTFHERPW